MKIAILNIPSMPIGNNIAIKEDGDLDNIFIAEIEDDDTVFEFVTTAEKILAWPEPFQGEGEHQEDPIPIVDVPDARATDGHYWMAAGTVAGLKKIVKERR